MDAEFSSVLETASDLENVVLEVSLDYIDAFHNLKKDLPVAPTEKKVDRNLLSGYQKGVLDQAGNRRVTTPKLVGTLTRRKVAVH